LLDEKERICRKIGNVDGLARTIVNRARLLGALSSDAWTLLEEAQQLAEEHSLPLVAEDVRLAKQQFNVSIEESSLRAVVSGATRGGFGSMPHPTADANRASQLNIVYQEELARWNAGRWWQRLLVKRPKPPKGI
jgi:hypothetical protein